MENALNKANKKASWVFRTFSTRNVCFLKKIWKSVVQCHLDYGSILWSPVSDITELKRMESPLRAFTRKGNHMSNLNYWERLKSFKLYSQKRRNERYKVIYIWKSLNGLVPSLGLSLNENENDGMRSGPKKNSPKKN